MTKEILITIEGLQLGAEEDPIIDTACGSYHLHNDRHYIQYEEKPEEGEGIIKNTMKIGLTQVEMTKKGAGSAQMTFDINQTSEAIYQTPYGNLCFEVKTSKLVISETPDKIQAKLEYALYSENSHLSDHEILITIVPVI